MIGIRRALVAATTVLVATAHVPGMAGAQTADEGIQDDVVEAVIDQGWWDESGSLSVDDMEQVVERWGDDFAFAFTDRDFDVREDPTLSPAALLAQATLERLVVAGGPETILFVAGDDAAGASTRYPYPNLVVALGSFDPADAVAQFDSAATSIASAEGVVSPQPVAQSGVLDGARLFILLGIITAVLALASMRSARKKKSRQTHTSGAKQGTRAEIQQMSDLILDLEPRITIANDPNLSERYAAASRTYSEVLEHADLVESGHEVADLRIEIARARWKLDVIDAELDGRPPPNEPFRRDSSGSAWDSTRGTGGDGKPE